MNRFLLFTLLLLAISNPILVCAQSKQEILVLEYRGEKKERPLANVEIIVSNAGSAVTDKDGRCTLSFNTLKIGDKVTCRRIEKPGYEIFNKDEITFWHITRGPQPYTIMMCETKFINDLREKYRKGATAVINLNFKDQELSLTKAHNSGKINDDAFNRQLEKLQQEYEDKLNNIETYIDNLAHADMKKIDKSEKDILLMLKNGDVSNALKAYEQIDLVSHYLMQVGTKAKLYSDKAALDQALALSIETQNQLVHSIKREESFLRILGGKENIEKIFKLYDTCLMADTANFEVAYNYALYLVRNNKLDDIDRILRYCQHSTDEYDVMRTSVLQGRIWNSRKSWRKTVEMLTPIYRDALDESTEKYDPYLNIEERTAMSRLLTQSFISLRDTVKAQFYAKKMMVDANFYHTNFKTDETMRNLVECLHESFLYYYRFEDDMEMGANYLQRAIVFQEELYAKEPKKHVGMLAYLNSHLGAMYQKMDWVNSVTTYYHDMVRQFETACQLYEEAYSINPYAYLNYIPEGYRLLAEAYYVFPEFQDLAKAKVCFDKCAFYMDKMDKSNVITYAATAAPYHSDLTDFFMKTNELEKAEKNVNDAIKYYTVLYGQSNKTFRAQLLSCYNMLNDILLAQNKKIDAKALEMLKYLEEDLGDKDGDGC